MLSGAIIYKLHYDFGFGWCAKKIIFSDDDEKIFFFNSFYSIQTRFLYIEVYSNSVSFNALSFNALSFKMKGLYAIQTIFSISWRLNETIKRLIANTYIDVGLHGLCIKIFFFTYGYEHCKTVSFHTPSLQIRGLKVMDVVSNRYNNCTPAIPKLNGKEKQTRSKDDWWTDRRQTEKKKKKTCRTTTASCEYKSTIGQSPIG